MGGRIGAIVGGLAIAAGLAQGAQAAIRYEFAFADLGIGFGKACDGVTLIPGDIVTVQPANDAPSSFFLRKGTLGKIGTYSDFYTMIVSEVNAGVPEPATWALLILGFGGVGSALRRRRAGVA